MVEDAPVNTGAAIWPATQAAEVAVRRMQIKLHRWALEDSSSQFGDLFNQTARPPPRQHDHQTRRITTGGASLCPKTIITRRDADMVNLCLDSPMCLGVVWGS